MSVPVCEPCRGMVRFLGVDMKKRRLDQTPEEGCKTQYGSGDPHEFPTQSTIDERVGEFQQVAIAGSPPHFRRSGIAREPHTQSIGPLYHGSLFSWVRLCLMSWYRASCRS